MSDPFQSPDQFFNPETPNEASSYSNVWGGFNDATGGVFDAGHNIGALSHKWFGHDPGAPNPILGLAQSEFDYYNQNISPIQQQLLQKATNQNTLTQNVNQAQSDVNSQFKNLPGAFQRQMSGLGVTPTTAQTAAFNKQLALSKGIATAGASNQAARATGIQQRQAFGY